MGSNLSNSFQQKVWIKYNEKHEPTPSNASATAWKNERLNKYEFVFNDLSYECRKYISPIVRDAYFYVYHTSTTVKSKIECRTISVPSYYTWSVDHNRSSDTHKKYKANWTSNYDLAACIRRSPSIDSWKVCA